MALPFLPGSSFNPNLGKNSYHKSHHFDYNNDVSMLVGENKPGIGGDLLLGQKAKAKNSVIPRGSGTDLPAWVAFDRQVLAFDSYFQEAVHEKREEQFRIRNCKVYFYLEDDSIQVTEPRIKNSGVPQGTLIRRHRIPKPPPNDDEFYTVEDFNIGGEITLYSRNFKLTDCDEFSKNFLQKLGVRLPTSEINPSDPYTSHRKAQDEAMQPMRPYEKHDTLKRFLDHGRHVLRCFCTWDDTDEMFGDPRQMVLHYFLADDTIEIREIITPNSGRDATPMFLRRARLPKCIVPFKQPGELTSRTVLNVFGPTGHGGRYILDSLKTGAVKEDFYSDADLTIGTVLNVWGRKFLVFDMDDFTKEYYRTKYNVQDLAPIEMKPSMRGTLPREMPPYNGFGSEEDSLCSCMGLLPKPPKRDFIKFMEKDRRGLDSNVLRFLGRMDTSKPIDVDRRFIISYFLSDDTILVFEPPVRNSGVIGGKFLERGRIKKPNQPMYATTLSEYYMAQDMYVGAGVIFNNHKFVLIEADEYAYNYMEQHGGEFPQANGPQVLRKLAQGAPSIDDLTREDPTGGSGVMPYESFRSFVSQLAGGRLTQQEVITLARFYEDRKEEPLDLSTLVAVSQEQLRKVNFDNFSQIIDQCVHLDKQRDGLLEVDILRQVCHSLKLPLPEDLLRALISSLSAETPGQIDYTHLVQCLNWRDHTVTLTARAPESDEPWNGTPKHRMIGNVNFAQFIQDLSAAAKS